MKIVRVIKEDQKSKSGAEEGDSKQSAVERLQVSQQSTVTSSEDVLL